MATVPVKPRASRITGPGRAFSNTIASVLVARELQLV